MGLNDVSSATVVSEQRCEAEVCGAGYHGARSGAAVAVLSGVVRRD